MNIAELLRTLLQRPEANVSEEELEKAVRAAAAETLALRLEVERENLRKARFEADLVEQQIRLVRQLAKRMRGEDFG